MKKKTSGFTLVELLAVIVILAVVIMIASSSVIGIVNRSKRQMAKEVRGNLQESALTYALNNIHLEKCSTIFSEEVYAHNDLSNLNKNTACTKKISIQELVNEGLFEDSRGACNKEDEVIIYRYNDGFNSEYKAYVSENLCNN